VKRKAFAAIAAVGIAAALTGCSAFSEQFEDVPIVSRDSTVGAEVINFPDYFTNVATKCNHGNRVYVTPGGTSGGGGKAIAVVPNDPTCPIGVQK
jgi:hypothetical protein